MHRLVLLLSLAACMDRSPFQGDLLLLFRTDGGVDALQRDADTLYWAEWESQTTSVVRRIQTDGTGEATIGTVRERHIERLAVDADFVYVTTLANGSSDGEVLRFSKSGGEAVVLAPAQVSACGMAVDATSLYWSASLSLGSEFVVRKLDKSNPSAVVELARETSPICALVADDTYVYWANTGNNVLRRVTKDGSTAPENVGTPGSAGGGSSDGSNRPSLFLTPAGAGAAARVYWFNGNTLMRTDLDRAASSPLTPVERPGPVVVSGDVAYYVQMGSMPSGGGEVNDDGRVLAVDVNWPNGTARQISPRDADVRPSLAVNDQWIYWGEGTGIYLVEK